MQMTCNGCFDSETSLLLILRNLFFWFRLVVFLGRIRFSTHINDDTNLLFADVSSEFFDKILSFLLKLWHIIEDARNHIFIGTVPNPAHPRRSLWDSAAMLLALFLTRMSEIRMTSTLVDVLQGLQTSLAGTLGEHIISIFRIQTYPWWHVLGTKFQCFKA